MKYDLELLKADILDELTKIEELVRDFRSVESKLGLPQEDVPFYDRAASHRILSPQFLQWL